MSGQPIRKGSRETELLREGSTYPNSPRGRDAEGKDTSKSSNPPRTITDGEKRSLSEGVAKPQGFDQRVLMKSVSYKTRMCLKCRPSRIDLSRPKGPLYPSPNVHWWVRDKVEHSRYIWELAGGCSGCAEVYEDCCRVLANLLHKLGVKI